MTKHFALCGAIALLCLTTTIGYSQKADRNNYWFGVGLGKSQFPSGMIALGYEFVNKPTLVTARYTFNGQILSNNVPGIMVSEFGLLYGLKSGKFRFSTGLSGVWGINRGKYLSSDPDPLINGTQIYEKIKYTTIGLPAEIRFITSTKDVGIGVTGFGNLNGKRSFVGLNLSFYIGQMKKS
ncbi:MAG: hypothetical protein EOP45_12025 [Sphingobacteriaceae bacterium]|nr:MAG: hypothetical protein EOP45_12025 [Sphingobacteriaceae bacterium]